MFRWLRRWWKHTVMDNYIYVVTDIGRGDGLTSICFYNMKDAADYAAVLERVTGRTVHINRAELL